MPNNVKRVFSVVLMLALLCTLSVGAFATEAQNYTYGSYGSYTNVILNWGERGVTATSLSSNAEQFYEDNDTSYAQLAALSGGTSTSNAYTSELYLTLQELMADNHTTQTSYGDTRYLYCYTDCESSDTSLLSCFYTAKTLGSWDGGSTWNREHIWPQSKTTSTKLSNNETGVKADIMVLRPTSSSVNSGRGSKAYGESTGYYNPNNEAGDTGLDVRGDVARILLYDYVRWSQTTNMWGSSGVIESLDILLKWMEEDPVDTWEMGRNDSVESITGTRNVFVDYPELAYLLFGQEIPQSMVTPSGSGYEGAEISVNWDKDCGSVSVSGNLIIATPASGYAVSGYTVTDGSATVVQNGNAFTVTAEQACTITVLFEKKAEYTLTYYANGTAVTATVPEGETAALTADPGDAPEGYTFRGWVTTSIPEETTLAPTEVYAPGAELTPTEDIALYALYTRLDVSEEGDVTFFQKYSGALTEGYYILTDDGGAMSASVSSANRMNFLEVTDEDGTITVTDSSIIWYLSQTEDNYWLIYHENGYASATSTNNKAALLSSPTDYSKWSCSGDSTYDFTNLGNSRYLRRNGDYGFAAYAASTGSTLTLYKQTAKGTTYYLSATAPQSGTEDVEPHAHSYTATVTEPTCTEGGYTTYTCSCGDSYVGDQVVATGHSYTAVVTEPTCMQTGYTTYTCPCGDSYTGSYTSLTDHLWGEWEDMTDGTGRQIRACQVCGSTRVQNKPTSSGLSNTAIVLICIGGAVFVAGNVTVGIVLRKKKH